MLQLQRASAGSGKTEQLARHYLQIFFRPDGLSVDPATVLAATFTREAAGEILARIFRILARACNEEAVRETLVKGTDVPTPSSKACYFLLRRLIDQIDGLAVGTIDALFARQASTLALDLGLASPWKIADALTSETLAQETMVRLLETSKSRLRYDWSLLHHGARQLSFVEKGALLLEKNRFIAHAERLDAVIVDTTPPKIISAVQAQEALCFFTTFEIPCNAKGKPDARWGTSLKKLTQAFSQPLAMKDLLGLGALIANCLDEEPTFFSKPLPASWIAFFLPLAKASEQEQQRLEILREAALQQLAGEYDELRRAVAFHRGSYTFSEIEEAVQAEHHELSREEIEFRMEARTEHLLLDEYQDTSQRQHDFLSPLVGDVLAKGGEVFVVGDVKQGIYGWRGGKRHLLGLLAEEHGMHSKEMAPLNQSYRSSRAVLAAVNEVFGALKNQEALAAMNAGTAFQQAAERWQRDFQPHEGAARVADLRGRVRMHAIKNLSSQSTAATKSFVAPVLEASSINYTLSFCAPSAPCSSSAAATLKTGSKSEENEDPMLPIIHKVVSLVEEHQSEDPSREIAILVRRTKFIPQLLQELRARGILASGEGGNALTDTLALEVLLSLLSWIDHPGHAAAYDHVLHSPLKNLLEKKDTGTELRKMLLESGYAESLRQWASAPAFQQACSAYERGRLEQLLAMADRFDAEGGGTPSDFVKRVRKERVESPLSMGVRVLSIHAAKGLEFESVILMDLDTDVTAGGRGGLKVQMTEEGNFFIQSNQEVMALQGREALLATINEEQWAEALSLLYVGMTRAASYLDLVVFEECRRKKTMAHWLRSSGLQCHEVDGISWRSMKEEEPAGPLFEPRWSLPLRGYSKLSRRSPSDEKEAGLVSIAQQLQGSAARERGIRIHAMLAEIDWASSDEQLLPVFQKNFFQERWKQHAVTRLEVWRERRFAIVQENSSTLLTGAFDRVVIGLNSKDVPVIAEIIDFKTDAIVAEQQAERELFYQPQLEAYSEALQQMLPTLEKIETRITWVNSFQSIPQRCLTSSTELAC